MHKFNTKKLKSKGGTTPGPENENWIKPCRSVCGAGVAWIPGRLERAKTTLQNLQREKLSKPRDSKVGKAILLMKNIIF